MAGNSFADITLSLPLDKLTEFVEAMERIRIDTESINIEIVHVVTSTPGSVVDSNPVVSPARKRMKLFTEKELQVLTEFENLLGYSFKNKMLLVEALTFGTNSTKNNYQRLEILGDAALGYTSKLHFYYKSAEFNSGDISQMSANCVCNDVLGILAVMFKFHKYILAFPPDLRPALDHFVEIMTRENFNLHHFEREETDKANEFYAVDFEVPKYLADIFEAVAGAISVDSSVDTVKEIFGKLLASTYSSCTPSAYLQLQKIPGIKIEMLARLPDGRSHFIVTQNGVDLAHGVGSNQKNAKMAAAKYALWKMMTKKED